MSVISEIGADGVAVITLDESETRNALTTALGHQLTEVVNELRRDVSVRVVVLTGAGSAFSAGGDLTMLEQLAERARAGIDTAATMRAFYESFLSLRRLRVPVVAAVNGHAIGAGLCVALACDLRIVADNARVGLNFVQLGLHPGMGGSWLLPRIVGPEVAAEWLYTGRLYTGVEAARRGIALEAVPAAMVLARAMELAREIASAAPEAVRQLKVTLRASEEAGLEDALLREAGCQAVGLGSTEIAERLTVARGTGRHKPVPDRNGGGHGE